MTSEERLYAESLLAWSRSIPEHRLSYEEWEDRRDADKASLPVPEMSLAESA